MKRIKRNKKNILLLGFACMMALPKMAYADNSILSPCESGNMTVYVGDQINLSVNSINGNDLPFLTNWYYEETNIDTVSKSATSFKTTALLTGSFVVGGTACFNETIATPIQEKFSCEIEVKSLLEDIIISSTNKIALYNYSSFVKKGNVYVHDGMINFKNSVDNIYVDTKLTDSSKAESSGSGNIKLNVGLNEIKVTVKNKSTNYKDTYVVNVYRQEESDTSTDVENDNDDQTDNSENSNNNKDQISSNEDNKDDNSNEVKNPSTGD